ncbi:MAG: hypothetical protein ACXV2C_08905 [Candidatus Bathyarchaeia archaeon]
MLIPRSNNIFGTNIEVPLKEKHAIGNTAKRTKEIRNVIVYSTGRYEGEIRHIPFTETHLTDRTRYSFLA